MAAVGGGAVCHTVAGLIGPLIRYGLVGCPGTRHDANPAVLIPPFPHDLAICFLGGVSKFEGEQSPLKTFHLANHADERLDTSCNLTR